MAQTRKFPDEASEPERLEAWSKRAELLSKQRDGGAALRFIMMAAEARKAAANLRAMRAARLRLSYSQGY